MVADDTATTAFGGWGGRSRRAALRALAGAAAGGLLAARLPALARAQEATPAAAPAPFGGAAYVGATDDPETLVAVVVGEQEARAYLCDGRSLVAWFAGPAAGDALALESADGGSLTATLGEDRIRGRAILADGQELAFRAVPAAGMAGLYEVVVGEGGRVTGAAAGGLRLDGVVAGTLPDGTLLVAGAVALPDGELRPLAVFATPDAAGVQRWVVLDGGRVTGGPKQGEGTGFAGPVAALPRDRREGGNFIDPVTEF